MRQKRPVWDRLPMTPSRFATFAAYLLVALSMWSPEGASALVRYALFVSVSGVLVIHTYATRGIAVSRAPEWVFIAGFALYVSLSAFWSDGGIDAAIKGMLIFSTLLVSISMANALGLAALLRIFYNAMCVFLMASLLVVIFRPDIGIETGWLLEGDWRGIAGQKNGLGVIASLAFVAALSLPVVRRATRGRMALAWCTRLSMIALSAVCLVNSGSRGALVTAAFGLSLVFVAKAPRALQRIGLVVVLVLAVPAVVSILTTLDIDADLIDVLGTTIDSNGRMTLWSYGLEQMAGRELFGFGVGGFWTPARVTAFKDIHGWVLDNFHNGYVTILVEGGVVGILLLVLAVGFLLLIYLVTIGNLRDSYVALAFGYAGMFLVLNLTENEIGRSTSLNLIMFLSLSFSLRFHVTQALSRAGFLPGFPQSGARRSPAPALWAPQAP